MASDADNRLVLEDPDTEGTIDHLGTSRHHGYMIEVSEMYNDDKELVLHIEVKVYDGGDDCARWKQLTVPLEEKFE